MLSFVAALYLSNLLFLHLYWAGIWSALTGMRFCSTTYKASIVLVCLWLKNIPDPLQFTCKWGFSLQPSTKESVSSRLGLSPTQTSLSWLFARLSTLARVTAFSMPEVITKMFSLLCLCTSIVTPLIILNMGNCIFVERHVGQHSSGTGAGKQNFTLYLIKIKTSFICGKCRLGSSCPSLIFIHHWRPTFTCFIKGSCWTKNKPLTFQLRTKPIFWQILNNLKWKHTCILITPAFLMGLLEKSGSGLPVLTPSHTWMLMSFSST